MIPKFRLVDKVKKEIWNVESISWDFGVEVDFLHVDAFNDVGDTKTFSRQFELLQSTGLKDKNGVVIYEGDVIRNNYGEHGYIKWSSGGFVYHEDGANFYLFSIGAGQPFEVIGNIYEHPHLLEE